MAESATATWLSGWLAEDGYDRPRLGWQPAEINYASAVFKRPPRADEPALTTVMAFTPPYPVDGLACAGSARSRTTSGWRR
jgi:hypothetical protein